jgi:peptidoglycan/LPS O-acetylase OafA/YrhL
MNNWVWSSRMSREQNHLAVLDGFRGLAVLIVMMSHSSGREMPLAPWLNFVGIGHVGVYLFFVLSGYLLTRNLIDGQTPQQFYLRRIFRIVPLYFCVLAGVLVYQAWGHYSPRYLHISGGVEGALLHFLFLKGDSVFWTLAAEFGFYMLLPLIVYALKRFGWQWLAIVSVIYFVAYMAAEKFKLGWMTLKFVDISHRSQFLDVFACGILAAYLPRRWGDKWVPTAFWGLLGLTVIGVSANFLGAHQPVYGLRWLSLLYGVVFGLAIVCATEGRASLAGILGSPVLAFMGKVGFGLYLLHFPVFQAVNAYVDAPSAIRLCVAMPVAIGLAWLAYQWIERPMIKLGRRLEAGLGIAGSKLAHTASGQ